MTFLQPEQTNPINYVIVALIGMSLSASLWVISAYNRSVNLEHEIAAVEASIRNTQTDKAQLQDKMFAALNGVDPKEFSRNRNLVEDKSPRYIRIGGAASDGLLSKAR